MMEYEPTVEEMNREHYMIVDGKKTVWQCRESLYRTQWLMAHNRLHRACHKPEFASVEVLTKHFKEYLEELKTAKEVVSKPA